MTLKPPRKSLHIPRNSKVSEFLDKMSKDRPDLPLWTFFEEILKKQPVSKEDRLSALYDDFVINACELYSAGEDEKLKLKKLKKIIVRKIFKIKSEFSTDLGDSYYEDLKKF